MTKDEQLLLYGNSPYQGLLHDLCLLTDREGIFADSVRCVSLGDKDDPGQVLAHRCLHALLSMAGETGFSGNLWQIFLTRVLVSSENSYSLSAERRGTPEGTVLAAALHDMEIFRALFTVDPRTLAEKTGLQAFALTVDYQADAAAGRIYSKRIRACIEELAKKLADCAENTNGTVHRDPPGQNRPGAAAKAMLEALTDFYARFGVGSIGLHKAFRLKIRDSRPVITPVARIADVHFSDLVGYEDAKALLIRNTEAFLAGLPANNCLLYGDAGTGKSSSIKALAQTYYDRGLRIIEIYRQEFCHIHEIIGEIKHRNYRFILYMDDLSFEEFETEYKYLKAVIEGGLEEKPENVLIYATSNRRHLVRESFADKQKLSDDDVHRSDTVQEKLSLFDRFGLTIYYGAPTPLQYREIVRTLAQREGVTMAEDELLRLANEWELKHAGYSGRTARQLIDDILGREKETKEA